MMNPKDIFRILLAVSICSFSNASNRGPSRDEDLTDEQIKALSPEEVANLATIGTQIFIKKKLARHYDSKPTLMDMVRIAYRERKMQEKRVYNEPEPAQKIEKDKEKRLPCQSPDLERPLVTYTGMKFKLDCSVCNGRQIPPDTPVTWQFQANGSDTSEPMNTLQGIRQGYQFFDSKKRLVLATIRQRNAGKYLCHPEGGGDLFGRYDVTVVEEPYFHLIFESHKDQPYAEERADDTTLFTLWSAWTGCNHCGEWGEKFRFGYCYARYRVNDFPGGVPCRSNVLPYSERQLFSQRKDEKIIRECEEACPRGKEGNSMSDSKAMDTYYVDFDLGRPTIPPEVEKQILYVDKGGSVRLLCPGGGLQDAIRWQNGTQHLMLSRQRSDRVHIDAMHGLHIRSVVSEDAQVFTCYHNRVRVVSITLKVVEPVSVNKKVKNNLMFVGIALTGLVGLIIWASVYKNRRRHSFDV
ncbi:Ig-like V-type domain-containing protein FAM187A [Acanthaster planci]|uniref:Ig-like V-type domain-containing protein FAM187A n=1 Tax=Acanthaster planci TaxID=133434 RepID=A0A8B7XY73_ACAPL|nr:Ig-like V-type domain-containing protein FAM187A [Acanthaster planci]